jgi:hypothetical protein
MSSAQPTQEEAGDPTLVDLLKNDDFYVYAWRAVSIINMFTFALYIDRDAFYEAVPTLKGSGETYMEFCARLTALMVDYEVVANILTYLDFMKDDKVVVMNWSDPIGTTAEALRLIGTKAGPTGREQFRRG